MLWDGGGSLLTPSVGSSPHGTKSTFSIYINTDKHRTFSINHPALLLRTAGIIKNTFSVYHIYPTEKPIVCTKK